MNKASCGLLLPDGKQPQLVQYGEAVRMIKEAVSKYRTLNLVLEAPLSVAFNRDGNPTGRRIEKKDNKIRYWYTGAGCTVMVAAMRLLEEVEDSSSSNEITLFEGFVSYKDESKTDHVKDVKTLKSLMERPKVDCFWDSEKLKNDANDELTSVFEAFQIGDMGNIGVPPVISNVRFFTGQCDSPCSTPQPARAMNDVANTI